MQTTSDHRAKAVVACALMVIGFYGTERWLVGSSAGAGVGATTEGGRATETMSRGPIGRFGLAGRKNHGRSDPFDPTLYLERLRATEASRYEGSGRNVFRVAVQASESRKAEKQEIAHSEPPRASAPPAIRLRFFGLSRMAGVTRIFLSKDEDVFIAAEGDIIDRRYRIVEVKTNAVEVEDVLNSHRQTIFLTRG